MKKIIIIIGFLLCNKVYAINNITIDGENIIPKFDSSIKKYNYYTNKDKINILIDDKEEELLLESNYYEFSVDDYKINIFKNYSKEDETTYIKDLKIDGYNIQFDRNINEYFIEITDEDNLNIEYELSNDEGYVVINGNGNFNKSDNLIIINVDNKIEYKIHALKTMNVSLVKSDEKEKYVIKKEIAKYVVITISCIIIFMFYYLIFNKNHFYISLNTLHK